LLPWRTAADEEVLLDQAEAVRQAQAAEAEADRLGAVAAGIDEIVEVIACSA